MSESEILARLGSGLAVVVRLPGLYQPYGPFLRRLRDEGRLVRIARPSRWGNPYRIASDADEAGRAATIALYARWLVDQADLLDALPELTGKALACYCAPLACHGDVLAARVNAGLPSRPSR